MSFNGGQRDLYLMKLLSKHRIIGGWGEITSDKLGLIFDPQNCLVKFRFISPS